MNILKAFFGVLILAATTQPVKKTEVTITWTAVTKDVNGEILTNLQGYRLSVSKSSFSSCACPSPSPSPMYSASPFLSVVVPAGVTSINVKLDPGNYYAAVSAFNAAGESPKSNELAFFVPKVTPLTPTTRSVSLP